MTPKPPIVSPVRARTARTSGDAMEIEEETTGDKVPEATTENKTMAEASGNITKENEVLDNSITAAEEEASKEEEQAASGVVMAERFAKITTNQGRRNNVINPDEEDDRSVEDVTSSAWGRQLQPMETNQRRNKQTTLNGNKSIHKEVVFIKARVSAVTSPLEGTRSSLATEFTEISGGGINNLKILSNQKAGGAKPITSASMIPLKWDQSSKYVTCLNDRADLTKRIT